MKSRVEENKELLETCKKLVRRSTWADVVSLEKTNSTTLSVIGAALIDISQSLAVIADAMSKEETDDPNSVI